MYPCLIVDINSNSPLLIRENTELVGTIDDQCEFVNIDRETKGNWGFKYGSLGYITPYEKLMFDENYLEDRQINDILLILHFVYCFFGIY